jgi:uncharacterized alkaline shock family protein YloU
MRRVVLPLYAVAALLVAAVGVLCILQGFAVFSWTELSNFLSSSEGVVVLFALGSLLLIISLHFVVFAFRSRTASLRFSQEGEWGRIELSPRALREFITSILRDEVGIDRFQVHLRRMQGGIGIVVETALSPQERVGEIGRRIQGTLARRVVERTGVEVKEVAVLVKGIRLEGRHRLKEEESDAYYQP